MKKFICTLMIAVMMVSMLTSCKSPAERELEKAKQAASDANAGYKSASQKYDDLKGKIDSINKKSNALSP